MNIEDLRTYCASIQDHCDELLAGNYGQLIPEHQKIIATIRENVNMYIASFDWDWQWWLLPLDRRHSVSHEIRVPATPIKGYADLILRGAVGTLESPQREVITQICDLADKIFTQIQQFFEEGNP